jgi:hypothetical protein
MKLKDVDEQPPILGLPASRHEWWNLEGGYEATVYIRKDSCDVFISEKSGKDITYEVATCLGVDTNLQNIIKYAAFKKNNDRELYLYPSINCYGLNYTKPKKYKELLKRIEEIINQHFKNK